ncbi:gamma-tubulin complex component 6 [Meles meles]|uniref:gamma-tubulin complex component 6 n=1 Tax=Meles meles TaxID=9662 RepID=UPI001E6A0A44|nr:gamma-tubulin complex component 6 [Meles meles]XP_045869049.1 gamma-tubulin complex component 6 [Meles meles]XP_045869050.1 gamma-tubulin complex component 6 [Meles meles]XP_045869051.1 gamma-tubulin complex component 6 [Meles meles]XP_045869052.1 gamma-tubulin complex component 6 [Meles meles]
MASVPQLLDDLCEALLPAAKAPLGRRGVSRKRAKRSLKRVAYNALFTGLFQDETHRLQPAPAKLPVKNKVLMLSFDLRVGGLGPEADRLEALVEELLAAPRGRLGEVASVLDLLVQLAGSGPPQVLQRKRDYFWNNRHVGRNVPYGGYDCYDLSVFELDVQSLISREEYLRQDMIQKALQVMEAAPGTGLPTAGLFSYGDPCSDRFERDTRVSLFGALVHSRTYDMDVRLDLPPVPDSADLSGLAIKVPQSVDQSDDEGFQSASNLTPDSQSEPGMTPDIDLWDAVLTYEASKRRCWEQVGCPPGHREEPYLTEAGRDTFDRFCRLRLGELQVLGGGLLQAPQLVLVKECELVKDVLNVLIGVVSATFSLCQPAQTFMVKRGVHVSGASPESISSLLSEVAECGTHYARLSQFSLQPVLDSSCDKGLVFQAFTSGLRRYLHYYRACVLSTPPTLSLLTVGFLFKKLGRQLRYLAELCGVGTALPGGGSGEPKAAFPTGVKLLSYLYQEALDNCSNEHYPVLLSLLKTSCEPYTRFIHDWVYGGVFRDVCGEFMIQVNHEYLGFRDKFYWTHGYVLISKEVEDCVPVFLKHIAHDVYVCGKTINLLKVCCPRHYLCWSDVPVPRISVIFSPEELKEVERDCAIYVGRMERVARHSSISKEEKELRMEIAKQELIVQAREAASRVLQALSDRQTSERMALDAQKREQFQRLKEQFVQDQERRRAARQEALDDDFGYTRELRDRERRLRALEEQLERKARQALVDHYSKLSAEAARREQKALWKIQRHRLASARLRFLVEDQRHIQGMLKDMSEGKALEPLAVLPAAGSQTLSLGCGHLASGGSSDSGCAETRHVAVWDRPDAWTPQQVSPPAAGACGSGPGAEPGPGDRPGPFSEGLSIQDFLPRAREAEPPACASVAPVLEQALQTIGSDLPPSAPSDVAATGPAGPQEYDFRTVLRPAAAPLASPGSLQAVGGGLSDEGQQLQRDSVTQPEDTGVPDRHVALPHPHSDAHTLPQEGSSQAMGQLLGHTSEGSIPIGGCASGVAPSRPRWNVHGHVSDASIKVGDNVWDVAPSRPRWNVHGHVSDASIKVGDNVWDVAPSRPRWNVHGHVSDASIKVGDNVWDVAPSRPRWNVHGHVSDANIKVGDNVWDVAPSRPRWNVHGHVSNANIKVGDVWDVAPSRPRWNVHGHVSQCHVALRALSGEGQSDMPRPCQSLTDQVSRSGLSLGAQSPVCEQEPRLPTETASDSDSAPVAGSSAGEPRGLQASPSAVAASGDLGDGTPGEPGPGPRRGTWDLSPGHPPNAQDDGAAQSSPGLGEEAAAAQRREQAYLAGLAEQYGLEQYPDSYEAMSEPPVAHLLHHGLPRAFALPEDPRVRSDADETAVQLSELLPLPVLMKRSISAPLAAHISLVNKAAVDYFFVELRLEAHFEALRHFLLMEDGEFAQSLSDLLFEKLGAGQTPGELLNPLVLNSVLSKALRYSLHGDTPHAANLAFALKFLPEAFAPNAPDVLSCLELRYKVDWPLNVVLTEGCLSRYSGIFSFLLQLKLMMWTLKDICFHLKRAALVSRAAGSVQFRQLQLFKHEMQHFVKVTQGYIANQILHVTWCEFRARLAQVGDLEDIQRAHAEYLHKAVFRGLLTEKAAPVMNVIHSIFSLVLKFRSQLISQPWVSAGGPRGVEHPNFALMQQSYSTFKYYSHFLFKVVTKLVNRGYQPHLEDFLLRINFNNYYQDA